MKAIWVLLLASVTGMAQNANIPHLERRGAATQFVVDGKPFLMLGAELHNSSSSSLEYMKPIWPRLKDIPLNTVLTPLSWELVEPVEGKYDFALLDGLIQQARQNDLHVVFLWLASWKNGMSSYAPVWVKQDTRRFPRVIADGKQVEILSTFGKATMEADARAFAAVMRHIREVDQQQHTVLMMQVENEVGVLGDTRDHSAEAEKAFGSAVPTELTNYFETHREALNPELRACWDEYGSKKSGTWEQVFGPTLRTDEIFMAWHFGQYVNTVAAAGKREYALPMYTNTWLAGESTPPGMYPSGGPQPRVIDIWKAAGSAIDIYSPDIYQPNFEQWSKRYHRADNPLFIPEARGDETGAANVFYAVGEHAALGFSPFGIDSWTDKENELGKSYGALMQLAPLILEHQTKRETAGFVLNPANRAVSFVMRDYLVEVSLDSIFGSNAQSGFGVLVATGENEFMGAGGGFRVKFQRRQGAGAVGISYVEEGRYAKGRWVPGRRLNGDENDQGNYWRFAPQGVNVEKAVLYRW